MNTFIIPTTSHGGRDAAFFPDAGVPLPAVSVPPLLRAIRIRQGIHHDSNAGRDCGGIPLRLSPAFPQPVGKKALERDPAQFGTKPEKGLHVDCLQPRIGRVEQTELPGKIQPHRRFNEFDPVRLVEERQITLCRPIRLLGPNLLPNRRIGDRKFTPPPTGQAGDASA